MELYRERKEEFDNPGLKTHNMLYGEIADAMTAKFKEPMTREVAEAKVQRLRKKYKQVKKTKSGDGQRTWMFFNLLNSIFDKDVYVLAPVRAAVGIRNVYERIPVGKVSTVPLDASLSCCNVFLQTFHFQNILTHAHIVRWLRLIFLFSSSQENCSSSLPSGGRIKTPNNMRFMPRQSKTGGGSSRTPIGALRLRQLENQQQQLENHRTLQEEIKTMRNGHEKVAAAVIEALNRY